MMDVELLEQERETLVTQLTALLVKYKKNIDNVPKEELEGKYKVPFTNLKNQIREISNRLAVIYLLIPYEVKDTGAVAEIQKNINEHKKMLSNCLYVKADAQAFLQELVDVQSTLSCIVLASGGSMMAGL